eukprot:TRINITY_DN16724_c0_g1_i1.p2 TRINITY_DN16724_c0_g1~~TRINITY_DN16724_c0_g1_i1.p2  ORF type:complete len:195 (-),score=22.24 TRINITY_DN16724_c0_g1_i1:296-880(-)
MALAGCSRATLPAFRAVALSPASSHAPRSEYAAFSPISHRTSFVAPLRVRSMPSARSRRRPDGAKAVPSVVAVAMQDTEGGDGPKIYPPGLGRYESMIILRPDITEEERQALSERYEETLIGTGALDVELFNRGMQPLQYPIKKRSTAGLTTRYLDGWYLLFTYVTKPEAIKELTSQFKFDDDVIRALTFRRDM